MRRYAFAIALTAALAPSQERQDPGPRAINSKWAITQRLEDSASLGLEWLANEQHPSGYWEQDIGFKLNSDYHVTA